MNEKNACSRVISVRLAPGCYRHVRIPSDYTLEDLAAVIIAAFEFDNDHAHAFFMDNQEWSDADAYYMAFEDEEDDERHTCDYTLDVLKPGQSFKFVFDFGDNWCFQCKFLREMANCEEAELLRAKGEPPEQYPMMEEWDDDEES